LAAGLVALLIAVPSLALAGPIAPAPPRATFGPPSPGPTAEPARAAPGGLPGSFGGGTPIDASQIALHARTYTPPASSPGGASAPLRSSPPSAAPHPATTTGVVTGRVVDASNGRPIAGVEVVWVSIYGQVCLNCSVNNTTTSAGAFTLTVPTGADTITFENTSYLTNSTWVTVPVGGTVNLGTVELVHDGYVIGVVRENLPGHPPVGGAGIQVFARDGSLGPITGGTTANGSFNLSVYPLPSTILFNDVGAALGFLPNQTYANATPYRTIDLGTIYLEGNVSVVAEFYDRLTNTILPTTVPTQLEVCTGRTGGCFDPITGHLGGNQVPGRAVPGPTTVSAFAVGYIVNQTAVGWVDATTAVVDLGRIYLEPVGAVTFTIGFSGGTPSSTGWAAGANFTVAVCSLDGLQVTPPLAVGATTLEGDPCWWTSDITLNTLTTAWAPPLRTVVVLAGVNAEEFPLMGRPIPNAPVTGGWPTAEMNLTWANVTPGRSTALGAFDVTPGTYLAGNVTIEGAAGSISGQFSVQVCSTDEQVVCGVPGSSTDLLPPAYLPAGCPRSDHTFCVGAPPGPDVLKLTVLPNATAGYGVNWSWVNGPRGCCAQDGHPNWVPPALVNVSRSEIPPASITGSIELVGPGATRPGPPDGVFAGITVCPAYPPVPGIPAPACGNGAADPTNGSFEIAAPMGWDVVTATAKNFVTNTTWIDVEGTNATGVIVLQADALVAGQVVDAFGNGIYAATVITCPVADPDFCVQSSGAPTGTDGRFNVTVPGGPMPGGTVEVLIEAAGYRSNWTWTSVAAGGFADVGTIVLALVGSAAARPVMPTAGAIGSVWVTGRLVDASTGFGVVGAMLTACPILGGACPGWAAASSSGGEFNISIVQGAYTLTATAPDHASVSTALNATGTNVAVGTLTLAPFARVAGRIAIASWESLLTIGEGAPGLYVAGCDAGLTVCGSIARTASDGSFNASVPYGATSVLTFTGGAVPAYGSALGGYTVLEATVDVNRGFITLSESAGASQTIGIFGAVSGVVQDGLAWDPSTQRSTRAAGFGYLVATTSGPASVLAELTTGGGGDYTYFLPADGTGTTIVGTGSAFIGANVTRPGAVPSAGALTVAPIVMPHFGYGVAWVVAKATGLPILFASLTATRSDPANATQWLGTTPVAQDGYANVTAPSGPSTTFSAAALGYTVVVRSAHVNQGGTSVLGTLALVENASQQPAWVQGAEINTVGRPPTPTVVDGLSGAPIQGADVVVTNPSGAASTATGTNALGQFLVTVPPGAPDTLTVYRPAYVTAVRTMNVAGGSRTLVGQVNLTGDGILAGEVRAQPGDTPVADATVRGCPGSGGVCGAIAYTNGAGVFWIAVPPGTITLSVETNDYLANESLTLDVATDTWTWIGTLDVFALATVVGTVRGLPDNQPLANATVSVCSTLYVPYGPCSGSVVTGADGSFAIPWPPGTYVLAVSAPYYNTTVEPLALPPGRTVSVGTVFLVPWGAVGGVVVSTLDGAPLANATVIACATWSPSVCSPTGLTGPDGTFELPAPPGDVVVLASADGYQDNASTVYVRGGEPSTVGTIALTPIAPDIPESIAGEVHAATNGTPPIAGAFVGLASSGIVDFQTSTGTDGSFALTAVWGTYQLVVRAPGFVPYSATLVLHTNESGLTVALATFVYPLTGHVLDRTTGVGIGSVAIEDGTQVLATSGPSGAFSVGLANGSYDLVAVPLPGVAYNALPFGVVVAGAGASRDLLLTSSGIIVTGTVTDVDSGLPVPGAGVAAAPVGGSATAATTATSSLGGFSIVLPPGAYDLTVSAPGYATATIVVNVSSGVAPLAIALAPDHPLGAGGGLPVVLLGAAALAAIAVAVAVALGVRRWRRPAEPEPPRWELEDDAGLEEAAPTPVEGFDEDGPVEPPT